MRATARVAVALLATLFALGCAPLATQASAQETAPDFIGGPDDWLNSKPLTLKDLKGKVVLVDFWEYTCVNCIRTYPYLKEWWDRYKDRGLVIVGIHSPEFKFAASKENVIASAKQYGLEFPILIDSGYKNWDAWKNEYWPNKFIIDSKGSVVYNHPGEGGYAETEEEIQKLLKQANPKVELPKIMDEVRAADKPGAVCFPITDEMYAGARGAEQGQFGYPNRQEGVQTLYSIPSEMEEGVFYLNGYWTPQKENLFASGLDTTLAMKYRAKEANIVLKTDAQSTTVEVLQDGMPVNKDDAGSDITFQDGKSYLTVVEPRMYSVTDNRKWGAHRLDFKITGGALHVYSFAFSSECQPP